MNKSILSFEYKRIGKRISHHIQPGVSQNAIAMFILDHYSNKCILMNDFTDLTKMYFLNRVLYSRI